MTPARDNQNEPHVKLYRACQTTSWFSPPTQPALCFWPVSVGIIYCLCQNYTTAICGCQVLFQKKTKFFSKNLHLTKKPPGFVLFVLILACNVSKTRFVSLTILTIPRCFPHFFKFLSFLNFSESLKLTQFAVKVWFFLTLFHPSDKVLVYNCFCMIFNRILRFFAL